VGDEFSWYITIIIGFLASKLHDIWTYFLTNLCNTLIKVFLVTKCRKMTVMGIPNYMILYKTGTEYDRGAHLNSSIWFTIRMDSSSSGWGPTTGTREDGNETRCYINSWQPPCQLLGFKQELCSIKMTNQIRSFICNRKINL
jgi:hypothetical protein